MTQAAFDIVEISSEGIDLHLEDLCRILIDSVADGAAISFLAPLPRSDAEGFWLGKVKSAVAAGQTRLFGAVVEGRTVGTVQLLVAMPPNQPHRTEIAKMIVHPDNRRGGLGRALMDEALAVAKRLGKTLVTLDTRTGDVSQRLYRRCGFLEAGVIPNFALDPDGSDRHATTYMYREL